MIRPTVFLLLLLFIYGGTAQASFLEIEAIEQDYADESSYGQVITEIKVEGNEYTRESIILRAISSLVGMTYTLDLARQDLLYLLRMGSFTNVFFTHLLITKSP